MADLKMPDINNVIIVGNLIKDPVIRQTTNGTPVANFTIASNRKFKDNFGQWKEDVCFVGIVAWYKLAESCGENLRKGSAVLVEGELQSRQWRTDDGNYRSVVEIKARRIQFLNKREMVLADIESDSGFEKEGEGIPPALAGEALAVQEGNDHPPAEEESHFDFGFRDLKL
ncbi:MAG: single-stranded DNA-binding protein [Calditrichaeota bacterium]|nr:single-stranded DNA-binding protein [Calditrichota bacterium]